MVQVIFIGFDNDFIIVEYHVVPLKMCGISIQRLLDYDMQIHVLPSFKGNTLFFFSKKRLLLYNKKLGVANYPT